MPASREDANLIVQLCRWGTEMGLEDAMAEVFSPDFDPIAVADEGDASTRKILYFFEFVGTFVKQGLLDRDLVFDLWYVQGIWGRVQPHVESARTKSGVAQLYENFEALVPPSAG